MEVILPTPTIAALTTTFSSPPPSLPLLNLVNHQEGVEAALRTRLEAAEGKLSDMERKYNKLKNDYDELYNAVFGPF
jgi:hypothetical protein